MYRKKVWSLVSPLLPTSIFYNRGNIAMSLLSNRNMSQVTYKALDDERDDMKYNYKDSNSTQNICPNDYVSPTIAIQHLSEDIGYAIVTNAAFKPNEVLFEAVIPLSELMECPDQHSIQLAKEWHWNTSNHPIRYIIHSCFNVNGKCVVEEINNLENEAIREAKRDGQCDDFAKFQLVALQPLARGTAVTVNYNSFEWEMSSPFIDSDVPSESEGSMNKEATQMEALYGSSLRNGAVRKGRVVRGYKFVKPDEKKFLIDHGLLLKHLQEK